MGTSPSHAGASVSSSTDVTTSPSLTGLTPMINSPPLTDLSCHFILSLPPSTSAINVGLPHSVILTKLGSTSTSDVGSHSSTRAVQSYR